MPRRHSQTKNHIDHDGKFQIQIILMLILRSINSKKVWMGSEWRCKNTNMLVAFFKNQILCLAWCHRRNLHPRKSLLRMKKSPQFKSDTRCLYGTINKIFSPLYETRPATFSFISLILVFCSCRKNISVKAPFCSNQRHEESGEVRGLWLQSGTNPYKRCPRIPEQGFEIGITREQQYLQNRSRGHHGYIPRLIRLMRIITLSSILAKTFSFWSDCCDPSYGKPTLMADTITYLPVHRERRKFNFSPKLLP